MANPLINRSAVRQLILDRAKAIKPAWQSKRVAESSLDYVEARLRNIVDEALRRHPTVGQTVKLE